MKFVPYILFYLILGHVKVFFYMYFDAVAFNTISDIILFQNLMQDIVESWLKVGSNSLQRVYLTITNVLYCLHNAFIFVPVSIHWLDSFCQ